MNDPVET